MSDKLSVCGIIPARGGSKGIPRKNIRPLGGVPLIVYTIRAANDSRALTNWYVSTEDDEIAELAKRHDAPVLSRPKTLAEDKTPMVPVVQDALHQLKRKGKSFDVVFILQPTCPLRTGRDIDLALESMIAADADSVVGVYRVEDHHPGRMYRFEGGLLQPCDPHLVSLNRQDLPPVYHRNGAVYGVKSDVALSGSLYGNRICPYEMPRSRSLNIDDEFDWKFAEWLMTSR